MVDSLGTWFSDLGISIGNFFSDLWKNISDFFDDLVEDVSEIFSWLGKFFERLYDFFIHLIIPTQNQWDEIGQDYQNMGDTIKRHIPFVGLFSDELKKAQETVEKTDFLIIKIPTFSFSSGGISVDTDSQQIVNVSEMYEPYRSYVRGGLFLIVVGLGAVYLVKYVLNFGITHSSNSSVDREGEGS